MSGTVATLLLVALWLAVGGMVAGTLARRGHPPATALTALVAWPVLLPALGGEGGPGAPGPFGPRIDACFAALRAALADPAAAGVVTNEELAALEAALRRADRRLAMVDRLLVEEALRGDPLAGQLERARGFAADEVEAVLRGVVQLRVQVGLVTLAGDTLPVRARMGELVARVRAIEELALA